MGRKKKNNQIPPFITFNIIIFLSMVGASTENRYDLLLFLSIIFSVGWYFKIRRHLPQSYRSYRTTELYEIDRMTGLEFEHFLATLFSKLGYSAQVTKGSGDLGADLIIQNKRDKTVVQAKCYSTNIGISAVQEVVAAKAFYKANHAMVVTNQYFTSPAVTIAKANHVELIDRDHLVKMLNRANKTKRTTIFVRLLELLPTRSDNKKSL